MAEAIARIPRTLQFRVEFRGPAEAAADRQLLAAVQKIIGDDERVSFEAAVAPRQASEVLRKYDVLCCPSTCLEGGPTVAIEAHAVGTPVIGSAIGGLAELVSDGLNGSLVPPNDVAALAALLARVATDPANTIDRWREVLPQPRTMDDIAADYLRMYTE